MNRAIEIANRTTPARTEIPPTTNISMIAHCTSPFVQTRLPNKLGTKNKATLKKRYMNGSFILLFIGSEISSFFFFKESKITATMRTRIETILNMIFMVDFYNNQCCYVKTEVILEDLYIATYLSYIVYLTF